MSRKLHAYRKLIAPLFILFLLAFSFFLPLQPPSRAQVTDCPGNLVTNGTFTGGLAPWTTAYGTPDYSSGGYAGMWGNMNSAIGEALKQQVTAVGGKTYKITFLGRVALGGSGQSYAQFRVRASTVAPTNWGTANTVGRTTTPVGGTWTPITFYWTPATSGSYWLTFNVENDLTNNNGPDTSYGNIDNVCVQDVTPPVIEGPASVCQGQQAAFHAVSQGASSWNWDFGDGHTSTQQNPVNTYNNAGTFTVKLCVGGTANCATKTIVVKPAPPAPVITGPADACGLQSATYSVPSTPGLAYSWTVTGGTISGPTNTNSVQVVWGASGGSITVTTTNKVGCSSQSTIKVSNCDLHQCEFCKSFQSKTDMQSFTNTGNDVYSFTAGLSVNMPNVINVTAHIISASVSYAPQGCAKDGPINAYVVGASPATGFNATVPVQNGDEVIWYNNTGAPVNGQPFNFQIKFPPRANLGCKEFVSFCVEYTFTDRECRTCKVIKCYGPFLRSLVKD